MKTALITGINGQDGSYLAEYLIKKGYSVHGILKRNSIASNQSYRINHIYDKIKNNLYHADLCDMASLMKVLYKVEPDEIYNLGAQSHVGISFHQPVYTIDTIVKGTTNLLELILQMDKSIKLYQASSSEMFGNSVDRDGFQRETTPMHPVSPYGCAKLCAYNMIKCYREAYGLFGVNGILFNHESPRRGENFVSNKVVIGAVRIAKGLEDELRLGNLDSYRDWGHAKDYVKVMHNLLSLDMPDDFVCSTGVAHTVREMCDYVFSSLGLDYRQYVVQDPKFIRPLELNFLAGCNAKLKGAIDFEPEYSFETLLDDMIDYWEDRIC